MNEKEANNSESSINAEEYSAIDVGLVLKQVNFHFWGEVADWLKKHGSETGLEREKINRMIIDFQELSGKGIVFTNNPEEAERLAKEAR